MTVGELIEMLQFFPETMPVYIRPQETSLRVVEPGDVVMNLTNPGQAETMEDTGELAVYRDEEAPEGYIDSVVIYGRRILS